MTIAAHAAAIRHKVPANDRSLDLEPDQHAEAIRAVVDAHGKGILTDHVAGEALDILGQARWTFNGRPAAQKAVVLGVIRQCHYEGFPRLA